STVWELIRDAGILVRYGATIDSFELELEQLIILALATDQNFTNCAFALTKLLHNPDVVTPPIYLVLALLVIDCDSAPALHMLTMQFRESRCVSTKVAKGILTRDATCHRQLFSVLTLALF